MTSLQQVVALVLFISVMIAILACGLAVSQLFDPSLWVAKRSGLGWTLNIANPHAPHVLVFSVVWLMFAFLGLTGLNHPEAPIIGGLMRKFGQLLESP